MDEFFSKYGWLVVAALVICVVLLIVSPVGEVVKTSITNMVNQFAGAVNTEFAGAINNITL
ncbi:hypothetical protein [Faecalicoccus pleomorphus]|uniref:hypothetical protein n=1 Tax=Faecalicoccus pleomorphus TaxID=1323 RepID=UPI002942459A|nr:hypothetical protein [Faecalicoccus pleomorphus]